MSLAQIGSESVWVMIDGKKYFVRELYMSEYVRNFTPIDVIQILNAWKTSCMLQRNLITKCNTEMAALYKMNIIVLNQDINIFFNYSCIKFGLLKDIRFEAIAVKASNSKS